MQKHDFTGVRSLTRAWFVENFRKQELGWTDESVAADPYFSFGTADYGTIYTGQDPQAVLAAVMFAFKVTGNPSVGLHQSLLNMVAIREDLASGGNVAWTRSFMSTNETFISLADWLAGQGIVPVFEEAE